MPQTSMSGRITKPTAKYCPLFVGNSNQYGGMKADDAKRLKELDAENARLKQLVAELALDKRMLQEVVAKKF